MKILATLYDLGSIYISFLHRERDAEMGACLGNVLTRVKVQGLKPNVTYFRTRNTSHVFDLCEPSAASDRLWLEKSSIAELPLNLTLNIYAFSGFLRRDLRTGSSRRKERAFQDDRAF
jgi:hypothetical protein